MCNANSLFRRMAVAVIGFLISSQMAWAEMPPRAYMEMQDEAREALQIEVLKIDGKVRRGQDETSHFTLKAKVVCVGRSATGLKPGATITIRYSTVLESSAMSGAMPIGIVEPGIYAAYLTKSGATYAPVAISQSFIPPGGTRLSPRRMPCGGDDSDGAAANSSPFLAMCTFRCRPCRVSGRCEVTESACIDRCVGGIRR
jgi:hypothetical protein